MKDVDLSNGKLIHTETYDPPIQCTANTNITGTFTFGEDGLTVETIHEDDSDTAPDGRPGHRRRLGSEQPDA